MIADNLSNDANRDLTEEQRYKLDEQASKLVERRKGQRNDLLPEAIKGRTMELVAQKTKQPLNRVRTRKIVFASPVSTPELKADVNAKMISPTRAAEVITEVIKEFKITKDSSGEEVEDARAAVNERYKAPRAPGARKRTSSSKKAEPRRELKAEDPSSADDHEVVGVGPSEEDGSLSATEDVVGDFVTDSGVHTLISSMVRSLPQDLATKIPEKETIPFGCGSFSTC
jgi:hypothetical protein